MNADWYVFYYEGDEVKMVRIASNCLGNALAVAQELASRCNLNLVGVAPDLGVGERG